MWLNCYNLELLVFFFFITKCFSINVNKSKLRNEDDDDGKSSLVFVFDTTGSMYNDLKQLREGAELILDAALEENSVIGEFVFVPFHDPVVGPATVTKDKAVFKEALNIVRVYGGGDCPEKSLGGIQLALNVSRPRSYVYVFTDATASDHLLVGKVLDSVQRKQTQVVFVLTGHCNDLHRPHYMVYHQIAAASSGQVFNLNKTSVHNVLDFVRASVKARTVNLGSAVNEPGYNYTQGIPIDRSLGEVTVSVSGIKPAIRVMKPSGEQLTPPQLVTTLDLAEIMVVKVLQPEPGNWSIATGSEARHSVRVVGASKLTFHHGFAVEEPVALADTSYRPLQGTYNHMLISLTRARQAVDINFAEILSLDGKTLFEIPLKEFDAKKKIYKADPFIPPDEFFYIAINGRDEYNQTLRRVGATAVQAKPPDAPYLTVLRNIEAKPHEPVVLKCVVESLVPVTAMWTKDGVKVQPLISSLQSTSVEYVISDLREDNSGLYECVARNVAGVSTARTEVTLIVEPPQMTIAPSNLSIQSGQNVTVSCMALSDALLMKFQLLFNGTQHQYVLDYNLEPNMDGLYKFNKTVLNVSERDSGIYTCRAVNRGGQSNQSAVITVQTKPLVQILGPHTLTKLTHTDTQLVCHVENAERLVWISPDGYVVRDVSVNGSVTDMLDVKNVSRDGVWTCMAFRGTYNASDAVEIKVLIKPTVRIEGPKNVTVLNGTSVDLVCHITAKPEPRILWHRETEDFLNNTVTNQEPNEYTSVLTLNSSAEDIRGTYFCFGENSQGIHQDSVSVRLRRNITLIEGFTDQITQLYSQVALPCKVDSYPPANLTWYHNNSVIDLSDSLYLSEDKSVLFISKVDFQDLGKYSCVADNEFEKFKIEGILDIEELETPILSKEPVRRITQKGKSTILSCRVLKGLPQPTLTWQYRRNTSDPFTSLPLGVVSNKNGSELIIMGVEIEHWGLYRCVAENVVGKDYYDVFLVVQFPPELKQDAQSRNDTNLLVRSGERVHLSCDAVGNPPPLVTWIKDGRPLRFSGNMYLSATGELVIEKATEYDSGVFVCIASSALGTSQRNFTLMVYEPPSIVPSGSEPTSLEVLEGELVELACGARGSPRPRLEWRHNGGRVRAGRMYVDEFGLRFVANLTDFGEYECIASNEYGNTSVKYFLYIWVLPYIESPLETTESVLIGNNISLQCDAVGFPVPHIFWEFNNTLLTKNSTDLSFNGIGNLNITNASSKNDGVYVCIADNTVGTAKKSIKLNVYEPPKILEDNFLGSYIATTQDKEIIISCKTTGNPKPYIVWSKDGRYIDKDARFDITIDGSLIIKDVSEEQSGEFSCLAKNIVGTANKTAIVDIFSLPSRMQADACEELLTFLEGSAADIECPSRISPTDQIKWYKDAKLISTSTLKIPNITRNDASSYACAVNSTIGPASCVIRLNVEWSPRYIEPIDGEIQGGEKLKVGDENIVVVSKGDDVFLDCSVDAKPKAQLKWLFNSKPVLGEDNAKLKLMNVERHREGAYKCIAGNRHGTITKLFKLQVLEPPYISEFDLLDVELKEGMNATLQCHAIGSPTPHITWTHNNTNWHVVNNTLNGYNITPEFEGLYRCDATNEAGAAHIVYHITVAVPAKVNEVIVFKQGIGAGEIVDKRVETELNSRIRISCAAQGHPKPIIRWIQNGNIMQQNNEDIGYVDLVLDKVTSENGGLYFCLAFNDGGFDERIINVDVLEPPEIIKEVFQTSDIHNKEINLDVISGQPFSLHCHSRGNPPAEVYWFKDGVPLRLFDGAMVSKEYGEVLVSNEARLKQSGNYTCVARNKLASDSVTYLVDVLVPPPIPKEGTKYVSVRLGRELNLTCPVQGSPRPYVVWIKLPDTEISDDMSRIHLYDNNVTLQITPTEPLDSGKYTCVMTNRVGTTEVTFDVAIERPPSIAGNEGGRVSETRVVGLRRSVVLTCQVDGNPPPKVTWFKDTVRLNENASNIQRVLGSSLLVVWSAGTRDAGQYICVAENTAGTAHRRFNVLLQVAGKWTAWSQWSLCTVTCGLGHQLRARACRFLDDYNVTYDKLTKPDRIVVDESGCKGSAIDKRKCHMPPCEEENNQPRWSTWSKWSQCTASCGAGSQARSRRCKTTLACTGDNIQIRKCPDLPPCGQHSSSKSPTNEVYTSNETSDSSVFTAETTFEMQPEVINTRDNGDMDESHLQPEVNLSGVYYDVNVTENLDGSYRGPCAPGYTYNNYTMVCEDIDECALEYNACHGTQACGNTAGAYRCACPAGFLALAAGQRCLDIDECATGAADCEHACVNTAGGWVCACPPPLRLRPDRRSCAPTSSYTRSYSHEQLNSEEYLSTTIDFPSRLGKKRN